MAGKRKSGSGPAGPGKQAPPTKDTLGKSGRRGRKPKKKRTLGQRLRRVALYGLLGVLVLVLIATGAFAYMYHATKLPSANADFETQTSFVYYSNGDDKIGQYAVQNRDAISFAEMPQDIKDAVVAAENRSFYTDNGIDLKGIVRAAFSNASGGATQGASTITQQYIKVLYLSQERSYTRKLKEAILSLKLQRQTSKQQILEGYLNTIYFGRGAYGIQAAAQAYFLEPASALTLKQSAVLASVLNNPSGFDPGSGSAKDLDKDKLKALRERYQYVLEGMAQAGNITDAEAAKAEKRLPKFPAIPAESTYGGQKGHVLTMVKNELKTLPNSGDDGKPFTDDEIDGGGLRITTTFTQKAMDAAEQGVLEARPEGFSDKELHIGAASVQVGTGAVRGLYAGQDYLESQINWALAGGQAGSSVKPFSLVAALEAGYSLKDTFDGNSPFTLDDGTEIVNEQDTDYGSAVNLLKATEDSINTAFTDLTVSMPDGPQKILDAMNALGIPLNKGPGKHDFGFPRYSAGLDPYPSITLGSATISPINMASAYATIANGGRFAAPYIIEKVTDADGRVLYDHTVSDKQVISQDQGADIAADVTYAMQQVVQFGTGTAALALDRPVAGKTGTATNDKDQVDSAWFSGFTPQMATSVMYVRGKGNEQLDGWLPSYFGGDYPAETWTSIMQRDMDGVDVEDFPPPAYVDGEAPTTGHAPTYAPPPPPSTSGPTRRPSQSASQTPTQRPTQRPTRIPTQAPTTDVPTQAPPTPTVAPPTETSCVVTDTCNTQTPVPTQTPTAPVAGAAAATAFRRWASFF